MNTSSILQTASLNGVTLAFKIVGSGAPLVLIHGAEADHSMFDGLVAELSRQFMTIAYDQRDSGKTENPASPYGLNELGDDVAGLIAHLGLPRAHVYGTSLGGAIAQAFASRRPDLVDKLILGSTWRVGRRVPDFNPAAAQELARLRADLHANAGQIATYFFTEDYLRRHPQAIDMFRASTRTEAQKARRAQMQANPPQLDLSAIAAPTLLLAGGADRLIPPSVTFEIAQHLKNSRTALLEGLPHVATLQSPELIAAQLRMFLTANLDPGQPRTEAQSAIAASTKAQK